jgi:ribonuclease P protein component
MAIATLKRRAEFLRLRGGRKWSTPAFVIEMRARDPADAPTAPVNRPGPARFGFTATKKLGNAVMRNRIRRRLKEAVRLAAPGCAREGCDYVLIARDAAADRPFDVLKQDLIDAFGRLADPSRNHGRPSGRRDPARSAQTRASGPGAGPATES